MPNRVMFDYRDELLPSDQGVGFIYPPDLFHRRLKEEFLRSLRTRRPFLFIRIPTRHFDIFGFSRKESPEVRAWRIAVLTLLAQTDFLDVKGYLHDDSGIGILFLDCNHEILEHQKRAILRNLRDANLMDALRLKTKRPFFEAYVSSGESELKHLSSEEAFKRFNMVNEGYFSIQNLLYWDGRQHAQTGHRYWRLAVCHSSA